MWLKLSLLLALCVQIAWTVEEKPEPQAPEGINVKDQDQDWALRAQDHRHKHRKSRKSSEESGSDESSSDESRGSKSSGSSEESSSSSSSNERHGKRHSKSSSDGSDEKRGSKGGRHHKRYYGGLKHKHGKRSHGKKHHREHRRHGHGKPHGGHQKQCPKWNDWQKSECLWPASEVKLPESCTTFNLSKKIPDVVIGYYAAKIKELNDVVQTLFKSRGATKPCGYCSKKIACRNRHTTSKHKGVCLPIDIKILKEECPGTDACELSVVNGGCPPPVPQHHAAKFNKLQKLKKFGAHKAVLDFYGENHLGWGAPNEGSNDGDDDNSDSSDESDSSQSGESGGKSKESGGQSTLVILIPDGVQENNATLRDYARKSGEKRNKHKQHLPNVPLWHCVKNRAGDKCLCCCGGYFPDVKTEKCVKVKHGNDYPLLDFPFPEPSPDQAPIGQ